MNTEKLFTMQKDLDERIESEHRLQREKLTDEKILALQVELGELANETRCFKFWSVKPPSERTVVLEEYVDGLHFILSIGLAFGYRPVESPHVHHEEGLVAGFLTVFDTISWFRRQPNEKNYSTLFNIYLKIGELLGFSQEDIEKAYDEKNQVNHVRQDSGY